MLIMLYFLNKNSATAKHANWNYFLKYNKVMRLIIKIFFYYYYATIKSKTFQKVVKVVNNYIIDDNYHDLYKEYLYYLNKKECL